MKSLTEKGGKEKDIKEVGMDIVSFLIVCLVGYFVGSINIYTYHLLNGLVWDQLEEYL